MAGTATPPDATVAGTQPAPQPAFTDQASLDAATQQAATAIANAAQNNVQNVVIIIRINSPGDDVISQSNTANAGAVATNTATTQQGSGPGAPTNQADPTASTGAAPEGTTVPLRVARPAPELARPIAGVSHPSGAGASDRTARDTARAAAARTASKGNRYAAPPEVAHRQAAAAAPRGAGVSSARESRPSVTPVSVRLGGSSVARAGIGAAHFISSLTPTPALPGDKADQISTAVIVTLLAVVLAALLGVGSTYLPAVRARAWP